MPLTSDAKHLLIDGYNIMHAWAKPSLSMRKGDLVAAREFLLRELTPLHEGFSGRITIVLDGKGNRTEREFPLADDQFSFVYSPGHLTADGWIERCVASGQEGPPHKFLVATGDQLERQVVEAAGAEWLSPDALLEWVDACRRRLAQKIRRGHANPSRTDFGNRLPL